MATGTPHSPRAGDGTEPRSDVRKPKDSNGRAKITQITLPEALRRGGIVVGGLALAGGPASGIAAADTTEKNEIDLTGRIFWDVCAGEYMDYTRGTRQELVTVVLDGVHGLHLSLKQTYKGVQLIDRDTGRQYQMNDSRSRTVYLKAPPVATTFVDRFKLVNQGSAPDLDVLVRTPLKINAKGEVTSSTFEHERVCK